jgi:hypothetical protein
LCHLAVLVKPSLNELIGKLFFNHRDILKEKLS